jgi:oxygen-independent coproporphyrinogen-3 oxidase
LYVHVPFCSRRCVYCDFSIAVRRNVPVDEYLEALRRELAARVPVPQADRLDTLYLGGGTPSRLGASGISRLVAEAHDFFALSDNAEITIEANPDDVSDAAVRAWKDAGVNRVSLGVQTFDDSVLAWMHRTHDASQARNAFRIIRDAGIENVSVDLIFALPGELNRSWQNDLETALSLEPDHISLYGLTIENATPLGRWHDRGNVVPASEDSYAEEFLLAHRMAGEVGFEHYEVSNFARPGRRSRHNSAYWSGAAYIGVGPSAHSFDGERRSWNVPAYAEWVDRLASGQSVIEGVETLNDMNRQAERVYLGLRTTSGYEMRDAERTRANAWRDAGWAEIDECVVRLTPEGWLRLDSLAAGLT